VNQGEIHLATSQTSRM